MISFFLRFLWQAQALVYCITTTLKEQETRSRRLWGKGGSNPNAKLLRNSWKNLFSAWVWTFLRKGGGSHIQTLWGICFSLSWDIFQEKGELDPIPNFLRNFCLLEMRPEKKFLKHIRTYKGERGPDGLAKIQIRGAFFLVGASLSLKIGDNN